MGLARRDAGSGIRRRAMTYELKDPVSGLTHMIGAALAIPGLVVLVYSAALYATTWHIVSFAIFGASLILLYTASSVYHSLSLSKRITEILRRIDHMMIYILIAGSYTPICLVPLRGPWGWSIFGTILGIAVLGIVMKIFWMNAPSWLYTLFYVGMGWLAVIAIPPLVRSMPAGGIAWLLIGGVFYTVGAVIYALKRPNPIPGRFGFHEIFHLFVLAGSASHFWLMYRYVLWIN
jgi:hemolysin III